MKQLLFFCLSAIFFFSFFPSRSQDLDSTMWVTDGDVHAIVRDSNTIYLGGAFEHVYPNTGGGAAVNLSDGKLADPFRYPYINGTVRVSVPDGKGGWYIGGEFTMVQGNLRKGLAHILPDNTLDLAWNQDLEAQAGFAGVSRGAYCLVRSGNTLYVGGYFVKIGGYPRSHVAAIDLTTGKVTDWAPQVANDLNYYLIRTIAVLDNKVYLGGHFDAVNGTPRGNLAAVDAATGEVLPWNPQADHAVWSLVATKTTVYAGGNFTQIGWTKRNYVAAVDTGYGRVTGWDAQLESPWAYGDRYKPYASTLLLHNNLLYVAGSLNVDLEYNTFRALDIATGQTKWYKKAAGHITSMAVANNSLYLAGSFNKIDYATRNSDGFDRAGSLRSGLASFDMATSQITSWNPDVIGPLYMTIDGDRMYLGGYELKTNRQRRNGIAALDAFTGHATSWVPQMNMNDQGYIRALAVTNGTVWVGGNYGSTDAQPVKNLTAFDKTTGQRKPWNVAADSIVTTLAVEGQHIYLGGGFSKVGGLPRSNLAAINALNGQLSTWAPNANGTVRTIAVQEGLVYAGGFFTQVNGEARNYLACIRAADGQVTPLNPGIEKSSGNGVYSVALLKNVLYVLGQFNKIGSKARRQLAAVATSSGQITNWNPNSDLSSSDFYTLAAFNNTVYVGGKTFQILGESIRTGMVGLDALSGKITWEPGFATDFSRIYAIAGYSSSIYVGGDFKGIGEPYAPNNGRAVPNFAAFGAKIPALPNYITGNIFAEENNDCVKNAGEKGVPGVVVAAEPGPYYGLSDSLGNYSIAVDTGTYAVRQVLPPDKTVIIEQRCPSPAAYTISFRTHNNTVSGKDFGNRVTLRPYLTASVTSTRRRRCFPANTTITYCNEGSLAADDVKVHLQLPQHVVLVSAGLPYTRDQDKNYVFTVGNLPPGGCSTIQIRDSVVCNNPDIRGLTQCTKVWITPANATTPAPGWDQSDITLKARCLTNGRVRLALYNTGTGTMTDSSAYRVLLDAKLVLTRRFKLAAGDSLLLQVPANGQTVRLEADQRPGHPTKKSTSVSMEGCGTNDNGKVSLGFVAQLPADDAEPEVDTECLPITDSFDPNDKLVLPAGLSSQHLTAFGQELEYTIRFQNTGNDYAYQVVLTDTLSEKLDIGTLRVAGASHPYRFTVSGKGRPVLTWTFDNINLPDSARDQAGSNGFVKFTVLPLGNLPEGIRIENFGDIFFDYNPPVRTNTVFNTLGVLPTQAPAGDADIVTICRPNQPVSAGPDRSFCDQDSVSLQAQFPQYGQGRWKRISGAGTPQAAANPYSTVTGLGMGPNVFEWSIPDGTCAGDSLRSRVTITRYASPPKPTIAYVGTSELTSSTEGPQYQWYYNGNLLPDNTRSIQVTRGGDYSVSVGNDRCVSALSDPYAFQLTAPVLARLTKVSPNPTDGIFTIDLPEGVNQATFTVFDALGRKVLQHTATGPAGMGLRQSFDLRPHGAGVYLVKIRTPEAILVKRILLGR